jgi:hypothetical protein
MEHNTPGKAVARRRGRIGDNWSSSWQFSKHGKLCALPPPLPHSAPHLTHWKFDKFGCGV